MIHETALIDPRARLADEIEIGPFAIVEADVEIGSGSRILAHAQILQGTRLGRGNTVGRAAILGGDPQDVGFDPATESFLEIGDNNNIREHVTLHRAACGGKATRVGDRNFVMAGAHMGHDASIGDDNVVANNVLIAGHVQVGNRCFLGGGSVYHQFLRVGDLVMAQGNGAFSKDIPPFTIAALYNQLVGLNAVGLRRAGLGPAERRELKELYTKLFRGTGILREALAKAGEQTWNPHAQRLLDFMSGMSEKGVCQHV